MNWMSGKYIRYLLFAVLVSFPGSFAANEKNKNKNKKVIYMELKANSLST